MDFLTHSGMVFLNRYKFQMLLLQEIRYCINLIVSKHLKWLGLCFFWVRVRVMIKVRVRITIRYMIIARHIVDITNVRAKHYWIDIRTNSMRCL